jgi:hypothetical protein
MVAIVVDGGGQKSAVNSTIRQFWGGFWQVAGACLPAWQYFECHVKSMVKSKKLHAY